MSIQQDLLIDYIEPVVRKKFKKNIITGIYTFHTAVSLAAFFVSLHIANMELSTITESKRNFSIFTYERLLPFVAIALFIYEKKLGWALVLILSTLDLFFKGAYMVTILSSLQEYISTSPYLLIWTLFIFLFSLIVPVLLFSQSVIIIFKINSKLKLISIGIAILLFCAIKFSISSLMPQVP